jgi:hypothetical protein
VLPIRGLRPPGVHHHRSVNEPGRITFICNPALNPPTVLLQLYDKVPYYIAATEEPRLCTRTRIALPLGLLLYMVLPTCWQGAFIVIYVLCSRLQDRPATRRLCPVSILHKHMYTCLVLLPDALGKVLFPSIGRGTFDPRDGYTPSYSR